MKGVLKTSLIAAFSVIAFNCVVFFVIFSLRHRHTSGVSNPSLLLLVGGFFIVLGLSLGFYFLTRRLTRSISAETGPKESKSKEIGLEEISQAETDHKGTDYQGTGYSENAQRKEAKADSLILEAILNSMFEGFIALDSELNIILVNPRFCSMFGLEKEQVRQGLSLLEFSRSAELEEAAQQVLSSGLPVELTLKRYSSGTGQHFHVFAAPFNAGSADMLLPNEASPAAGFPDDQQPGRGVVMVLGDISRLAKLEQIRKDFAANVSHELRTPIQVVKGFAENLLASDLNNKEEIRRFAEIIEKNTRIMENLTNDLLTLVSLEDESSAALNGNPRRSMEDCLLASLISDAVLMAGVGAGKKDITIEVNCPPDLSAKLYGSLIIQALVNLLNNGVRYSPEGARILVSAFRKGTELIIEVKDNGIGIPAEHLGRIFERFYRVDRSRQRTESTKTEGSRTGMGVEVSTGLGLAIVRHIALLHSGTAEAESHAGEGSLFRLRLPVYNSEQLL